MNAAAAQRQLLVAEAMERRAKVRELASEHRSGVRRATPAVAAAPEPVDVARLRQELEREFSKDIPWLYRAERRIARQQAAREAEVEAQREEQRRRLWVQREQALLDDVWERLVANEKAYVMAALDRGLRDHPLPTAITVVEATEGSILLDVSSLEDEVPERVPDVTPSGRPSTRKLSKTARNELFVEVLASNVLSAARRSLAAAPGLETVAVVALRRGQSLYAGRFTRDRLRLLDWETVDAVLEIETADNALLDVRGRSRELHALDAAQVQDLGYAATA